MKTFLRFLPFAIVITALSGLIFVAAQQDLRLSANEPQAGLAEDGIVHIERADPLITVVPSGYVDPERSTSPFVIVYDQTGAVLDSNLYTPLPTPPTGMFAYAQVHGEDRVTWQPSGDLRIAAVLEYDPTSGDFVLGGRSVREVEVRESGMLSLVFCGWFATMLATLLAIMLSRTTKKSE